MQLQLSSPLEKAMLSQTTKIVTFEFLPSFSVFGKLFDIHWSYVSSFPSHERCWRGPSSLGIHRYYDNIKGSKLCFDGYTFRVANNYCL